MNYLVDVSVCVSVWMNDCVSVYLGKCLWMWTHIQTKTHTNIHSEFPGDRGLSVLLFNAEGCRRYKATQCRGLMDQRPADLESCSEYWSPPNTDGRDVCVRVCEGDTVGGRKRNPTCVASCVCVSLWQRTQESGARVCMSESFLYVCVSVCACRRNCLCICVFVYASAVVCICHCLLILCSLRANQRRTYQPCLLHINLVDVRATVWNPCQGITKHSTRNNRNTREKKCLLAPSLQLIVTSKTQNLRSISGELEALL